MTKINLRNRELFSIRNPTGKYSRRFQIILIIFVIAVGIFVSNIQTKKTLDRLIHGDESPQNSRREGPFEMPMKGPGFEIFQPFYDMDESRKGKVLIGPPEDFIQNFEERISWVDTLITSKPSLLKNLTITEHATYMYMEMIKSLVSGSVFNNAEITVSPKLNRKPLTGDFYLDYRKDGLDWTYAGDTMTGWKRIDNIYNLLTDVIKNDIKGDYIETGVWRGGSSIYAKAAIKALEPKSTRVSYVCDSFRGLPPGEKNLHPEDNKWKSVYLEVSSDIVANNFIKYGMLDSNVVFAKGFFNETMPQLSKKIDKLSIIRLDGDMYESTVDVLYHLYDKLSIGGYVIVDDWNGFPAKVACEDFFKVHGISPEIITIDAVSVYWKKTEDVDILFWRYQKSDFEADKDAIET